MMPTATSTVLGARLCIHNHFASLKYIAISFIAFRCTGKIRAVRCTCELYVSDVRRCVVKVRRSRHAQLTGSLCCAVLSRPSDCSFWTQKPSRAPARCAATGASTSRRRWRPAPRAACTSWTSTRTPSSGRAGWLQWRPACPASTAPGWAALRVPHPEAQHGRKQASCTEQCSHPLRSSTAHDSTTHPYALVPHAAQQQRQLAALAVAAAATAAAAATVAARL
jgi:hypothetical protein